MMELKKDPSRENTGNKFSASGFNNKQVLYNIKSQKGRNEQAIIDLDDFDQEDNWEYEREYNPGQNKDLAFVRS